MCRSVCIGPLQGQARFQLYQKVAALGFAVVQSVGQLTYIRPYVNDFSTQWLVINSLTLVAGSMILVWVRILPCCNLLWCPAQLRPETGAKLGQSICSGLQATSSLLQVLCRSSAMG